MALPGLELKTLPHFKYLHGATQHCVADNQLSVRNGLGGLGLEHELPLNTGKYLPTWYNLQNNLFFLQNIIHVCSKYFSVSRCNTWYSGRKCTYYKESTEVLVIAGKENGLDVNAEKTVYVVVSRDQNAGRGHNIKIDNSSFARVAEFKYLRTTLSK
jgi:hypothetical protein